MSKPLATSLEQRALLYVGRTWCTLLADISWSYSKPLSIKFLLSWWSVSYSIEDGLLSSPIMESVHPIFTVWCWLNKSWGTGYYENTYRHFESNCSEYSDSQTTKAVGISADRSRGYLKIGTLYSVLSLSLIFFCLRFLIRPNLPFILSFLPLLVFVFLFTLCSSPPSTSKALML